MKKTGILFIGCLTGILAAGCVSKEVSNPGNPDLKPAGDYFDFATTGSVTFDVNYGPIGAGALLEIFGHDPLVYDDNGNYTLRGEADYKVFADEKGRFKGSVELPASAGTVYIYSPTWGVPMCVAASVENGVVRVDETGGSSVEPQAKNASTRAAGNLKVTSVNSANKVYSVVGWAQYGKISDINEIVSTGDITSKQITAIQQKLWGKTSKPDNLDNRALTKDTKHVNTTIAKAYENDKGETVNVTDAEIFLTILNESGWNQNSIGYYYYKTDECPASPAEISKYLLFPNVSTSGTVPYMKDRASSSSSPKDYGKRNAPLTPNTRIQLLYVDEQTGEVSTRFPAGYTIGFFMIQDAFTPGSRSTQQGTVDYDKTFIYSNMEWNQNYQGQQSRYIALSTAEGTVVYGVEDGADTSYEDVLFCIDANPNEAIQDPERPVIDPEVPEIIVTETVCRTYAFEDIWPYGGDYDLNDVIVEHKRIVKFNKDNYVNSVEDSFKPVQEASAAQLVNAFAVQYPSANRGTITLPEGAVDETATNSVLLFANAKTVRNQTFTVTRTFGKSAFLKENLETSLNPFIIPALTEGEYLNDGRTEVHLPKAKATAKADMKQIGSGDDAYYVDKDGKHPFAILIPVSTDQNEPFHFIPVTESVRIEAEYPDFEKWVESKGTENTDWYLNYKASK